MFSILISLFLVVLMLNKLSQDLVGGFTKGPSTKEVQLSNDYLSNAEDVLSAGTKKLNSLSRKRSNEVVIVEEKNHISGLGASQRSPKLQKVGNNDMQTVGCPNQHHLEISSIAHEPKHWTDVCKLFCNPFAILFGQEYWNRQSSLTSISPIRLKIETN